MKRTDRSARAVRLLCLAVAVAWLITPAVIGRSGVDAASFVASGIQAREHPDQLFPRDDGRVGVEYLRSWCEAAKHPIQHCGPPGAPLTERFLPTYFVLPPPAIPIVMATNGLSPRAGVVAWRVVGAAACVLAAVALARLFSRNGVRWLAATMVCLTPAVVASTALGQSSPLLFLALVAPVVWAGLRRLADALLVLAVVLKAFPAVALVALVSKERRRSLVSFVGGVALLTVFAIWVVGFDVALDWPRAARDHGSNLSATSNLNVSAYLALERLRVPSSLGTAIVGLAVVGVACLLWRRRNQMTWPQMWAALWVLALLASPQVWGHYLPLTVFALAVMMPQGLPRWQPTMAAGAASVVGGLSLLTSSDVAKVLAPTLATALVAASLYAIIQARSSAPYAPPSH